VHGLSEEIYKSMAEGDIVFFRSKEKQGIWLNIHYTQGRKSGIETNKYFKIFIIYNNIQILKYTFILQE
jgi:hypothetical protein